MLRILISTVLIQCAISQQYQQKVAPGVPPQNYQYQPPPQPGVQQVPQQQYQQQQYQPPPQQVPQQMQQQVPQQMQQQVPQQMQQQVPQQVPQQMHQQVPQQIHQQGPQHGEAQLLNPTNMEHERDHIQEHMEVPIDTSKMSEQELQFHYFKMHDADNNNKLDGCELIKSLIHWHVLEQNQHLHIVEHMYQNSIDSEAYSTFAKYKGVPMDGRTGKIDKTSVNTYSDVQLESLLEYALNHTDINKDGYVDYLEYRINNINAKTPMAHVQRVNKNN